MRRLGRRWQSLHRLVYAVAVLAVWHFYWQVKLDTLEPLIYAAILAVLLGERLWRRAQRLKRRAAILAAALVLPTGAVLAQDLVLTPFSDHDRVTDIRHAGDGSGRLYIVQQNGRVETLDAEGQPLGRLLDLSDRISGGNEQGLLSLAFAPDFGVSGLAYAWYTDVDGTAVLSRLRRDASDPGQLDPASETVLLSVPQPFRNHNGGRLQFGPDGYLYLSIGDGGSGGDPMGHGQNSGTLLGSVIRIDVDPASESFTIPGDNPFVGQAGADEIWATGLRNPWRMSFDTLTGELYIADVGQGAREEINVQPATGAAGRNYGWNTMEGSTCFNADSCDTTGLVLPDWEYDHGLGCSVTGGEVYRGNVYPALQGVYLYADFCSGTVWGLDRVDGAWRNRVMAQTGMNITTFGQAEDGRLLLAAVGEGVFAISDGEPVDEPPFRINAGLNDAWFDPATPGQGILVAVYPSVEQVFLAWFTFDAERPPEQTENGIGDAGHRWLTAFGSFDGTAAELEITLTRGGRLNQATPVPEWLAAGTGRLVFSGCDAASLTWSLPEAGLSGQITLRRVTRENVPLCETLSAVDAD
ncbi:hypothetical protein F3N42_03065 [Marinihelvus fidelis]|uniref:Glucose/Sorbosone dehydrogenase domain-containing protein n=2 Tax=Marinihelvus fidelis TaxID=2613842 RepID=A0A5N0TGK5_9GAMM|nr:hypothetical protein F3N42_03065 [Marinihelvus fidelis]